MIDGAWCMKCYALRKLGRYEEALSACNRSAELNPNCELPFTDSKTAAMNREEALLLLARKELVLPTTIPLRGITSIFGMMLAWRI